MPGLLRELWLAAQEHTRAGREPDHGRCGPGSATHHPGRQQRQVLPRITLILLEPLLGRVVEQNNELSERHSRFSPKLRLLPLRPLKTASGLMVNSEERM